MNPVPSSTLLTRQEALFDDLSIRIDERGSGQPILILHGAAGPRSVSELAEALAPQARVLVPTHPGFESEPRPAWFNSVGDLAFTYLDLLERLDLHDVVVIGLSFGGWIAAELAVLNTTRLSGLILIDAAGIQVDGHSINLPHPPGSGQAPNPDSIPVSIQAIRAYMGPDGLYNPKLRRRLGRVRIPVLCLWGENDPIVTPDYGRAYAQAFPDARFELIPEAGHLPQVDQPERSFSIVKAFVDSLAGPEPE
ncbi:alpha/beta fold hydrolase [Ktedonosporobacter rubrisoli]|uniref:Alpha/beta fold hydrolase n=1 Tax=Ktedonosporobacter rubrisoli TaxID=2509675 RepID=A0A4P6JHY9_KTERU|nr:alpha/beta hydrolase [Ktedonosporobacter rubrisoli]QBD74665.1 alpha/beta fold hydrolase [Ktedonosporobacter rubrisoli]